MPISKCCAPASNCSLLVEKYFFIQSLEEENNISERYIPDGHTAIVIHFTNGRKSIRSDNKKYDLPNLFFTIPSVEKLIFETQDRLNSLIIICKTSVFSRLFNFQMGLLSNRLYHCFDTSVDKEILGLFNESQSTQEKIILFEKYLLLKTNLINYVPDEIDCVYNKILSGIVTQRISEIMCEVNLNHRSFRRLFLQRVGVSAKELLRIIRVNHVLEMYRNNPNMKFNDVVFECCFFDQSHFIHDFKKIIGETPKRFFGRNLEIVKLISGKAH
jgi:AraC-like DNA-binding protein